MAAAAVALAVSLGLAAGRQAARAPARASVQMVASSGSCLILQNKGGGHGEIGYHLALQLAQKSMAVTILHEGTNTGKPPHNAYGDLDEAGVKVIWCGDLTDPACLSKLDGASFSAVVDNWSKSPGDIRPYAEAAKGWGVTSYAYVSSAGMYTPAKGEFGPIAEGCSVKSSGQRQAEELLAELGLPYSCFRPQYIYGPSQGKSYLSFFFDRITRGQPVPVPNAGDQYVTFTHAADTAKMIAAAVGNEAAAGQTFNCATSSLLTYDDVVQLCAKAAGKDAEIVHYDPAGIAKPEGFSFKFPFRDTPFFVATEKATEVLGFQPAHQIAEDIAWYYTENYVAKGGLEKDLDFAEDAVVLSARI